MSDRGPVAGQQQHRQHDGKSASMLGNTPPMVTIAHPELVGHPVVKIAVGALSCEGQIRSGGEDATHIEALAEVQERLPPIIVHRPTMRVIDGVHRLRVATLRGANWINVVFFDGSEDEAFLLAVRCNISHGLPLSKADRLAAASRVIQSYPQWSDRRIAGTVGLSDKTVGSIRRSNSSLPRVDTRVGRDGRPWRVSAGPGRERAVGVIARKPDASLREIAREAGISISTARDVRQRLRSEHDASSTSAVEQHMPNRAREERSKTAPSAVSGAPAADTLANLRRDPSLRYSESGRAILRLLGVNLMSEEDWARMVNNVPPHSAGALAQVARACANVWAQVARHLEDEDHRHPPSGA